MRATTLPSVLSPPSPDSAISMERALKQVLYLLETRGSDDEAEQDRVEASIDDVTVMLRCIDRSG